jgi:hypothetical protein
VVNGLKREQMLALNSTLLHELYFASMQFGDGRPTAMLAQVLAQDFGSVKRWRSEFDAMAKGLAGGSGWVLLVYVPRDRRLINQYASDHGQTTAGGIPILALDMYEHAYHIDFGANATAYIDAFHRNIDWVSTQTRYEDATRVEGLRPLVQKEFGDVPGVAVEEVKAMLDTGERVQVIDARPRSYMSRQGDIMDGAFWRDPERLDESAPRSSPGTRSSTVSFAVSTNTGVCSPRRRNAVSTSRPSRFGSIRSTSTRPYVSWSTRRSRPRWSPPRRRRSDAPRGRRGAPSPPSSRPRRRGCAFVRRTISAPEDSRT